MFIFVLAKNVLLCHFILFASSTLKFCNYWTSQTVDSKQLFTEVEVNSGGYLPSRESAR